MERREEKSLITPFILALLCRDEGREEGRERKDVEK